MDIEMEENAVAMIVMRHESGDDIKMTRGHGMCFAMKCNRSISLYGPIQSGDGTTNRTEVPICMMVGEAHVEQRQIHIIHNVVHKSIS
jgi:hypothetical protein